ncbi:hypothetical protein LZ554_005201 [Drepanopeziza brunnea f. sp. 'monogermtubi']|nr:hypothetical protein LZ554_005201 [Drepanopeziza brunnea f. sp. 'monogermtubi']
MNYPDSFRRSASSRRNSQRAEDNHGIGPSRQLIIEGPPRPEKVAPRREDRDDEDPSYRPGPSSAPPRRENVSRPEIIEEHETVAIQDSARLDLQIDEHGLKTNPQSCTLAQVQIHVLQERIGKVMLSSPRLQYQRDPTRKIGIRMKLVVTHHEKTYLFPFFERTLNYRRRHPLPSHPIPAFYAPKSSIHRNRRRTHEVPSPSLQPPHPPHYGSHVNTNEGRPNRRSSSRAHLRPPSPPTVPPGFVTPSPYLVSSYQQPQDPGSGHGHAGGGSGGGGNRHDLATLAEQPNPKANEKVRNSIVLCVYRHSQKAFDYRFVQLRSSTGHRLDGEGQHYTTDLHVFRKMRRTYEKELRGSIRRFLSFKVLSTVRLLQYGDGMFFRPDQEDDIFSSKFMRIWQNPRDELDGCLGSII